MIQHILKIICIFFPLLVSAGCEKIKFGPSETLKPIEKYSLKIPEPSGLALLNDKLWIVSDSKNTVYQTNLKGEIEFSFKINGIDPEGITVFDDSLLAIVLETSNEILVTDFKGNEISNTSINIKGSRNSGLEGITYNPSNGHFYLVNEKDPVLLIETDKSFNEISRKKIKNVRDLSGISYSAKEDCLLLVSDEDRKIIKASLDGEFIEEYKINVEQAEGIAIDDKNNLIYVVSDKEEKLFVFEM